jgi:hypothetical protein
MADHTIDLSKNLPPNYVSDAQYALKINRGDRVRYHAVDAEFLVNLRNADTFFIDAPGLLKLNITNGGYSQYYQAITDLKIDTWREYTVTCVDAKDQGDSPPKIIIVP